MKLNKSWSVIGLSLLMSCAAMQEQVVRTTCNPEGARQLGYNHAREGSELQPSFITFCPDHQDELLLKAYREGYESAPKPFSSGPQLTRAKALSFTCEATADGLVYTVTNASENEARSQLSERCELSDNSQECVRTTRCWRQ